MRRYTSRKRHGGWDCHATLVYSGRGEGRIRFLSRCFHCPCGEPLHDGDQVFVDPVTDRTTTVHVNCEEYLNVT